MHKPTKAEGQLLAYKREAAANQTTELSRLVLARKAGESITIGVVTVEVVRHTGKRTVLAITAPRSIEIKRSELLEKLVDAAIAAAAEPTAA